jgi:NAD(P)H-nitrite reductase large subunit
MTDMTENKNERICSCSGTTVGQVEALIERGVTDLEGVSRATGACSGCGACDTDVLTLIAERVGAGGGRGV